MSALFASGRAADLVGIILIVEALLLIRRGQSTVTVLLALAPGALILVALRAAVVGAAWPWLALPLALSFPIHVADLVRRGLWSAPDAVATKSGWSSDRQ